MRRRWKIAIAVVVILAALFGYAFSEAYRLELKQYTYSSPDIPPAFDGTRIVLLTDIHRGAFFSEKRVRHVVQRANALHPDLVLLGGDYVWGSNGYARSCFSQLARLEAPQGRFAVLGNHDYDEPQDTGEEVPRGPSVVAEAIDAAGFDLLDNRGVWLEKDGQRMRIGGVSDYQMGDPDLQPTVDRTSSADFVLLLAHNPDYAEELPARTVDLVLSGHTHGGQVTFFGLFGFYVSSEYGQKYRTGVVENGSTTVIVSNGIGGSVLPPVRFFAPPQIVEITLRHTVEGTGTEPSGT